jgi:hypothetical protein
MGVPEDLPAVTAPVVAPAKPVLGRTPTLATPVRRAPKIVHFAGKEKSIPARKATPKRGELEHAAFHVLPVEKDKDAADAQHALTDILNKIEHDAKQYKSWDRFKGVYDTWRSDPSRLRERDVDLLMTMHYEAPIHLDRPSSLLFINDMSHSNIYSRGMCVGGTSSSFSDSSVGYPEMPQTERTTLVHLADPGIHPSGALCPEISSSVNIRLYPQGRICKRTLLGRVRIPLP